MHVLMTSDTLNGSIWTYTPRADLGTDWARLSRHPGKLWRDPITRANRLDGAVARP